MKKAFLLRKLAVDFAHDDGGDVLDYQRFVYRIRMVCKEKGIPISKLESDLGWSPGLISRWTKTSPSVEKLVALLNYLNVPYETLLGEEIENSGDQNSEDIISKLIRFTQESKLTWAQCDNDAQIKKLLIPLSTEGCLTDLAYYSTYDEGIFFFLMTEDEDMHFSPRIYISPDRFTYPLEEKCETDRLGHLMYHIDTELYKSWANKKVKAFKAKFLSE